MSTFVFSNFFQTTFSASVTSTATTITVASGTNAATVPAGTQWAIVAQSASTPSIREVMYVTAISGTTFTVLRGQEGTSGLAWNSGDDVFAATTAGQLASLPQLGATQTWSGANTFSGAVSVLNAASSTQPTALGQFIARPYYVFNQSGSVAANPNTTYNVASGVITMPTFSKTGSFRLAVRAVVDLQTVTSSFGMQNFQTQIYDGSAYHAGAFWLLGTNANNGTGFSDTFTTNATYAANANVSLAMQVSTRTGSGTASWTLTNCFFEVFVEEA